MRVSPKARGLLLLVACLAIGASPAGAVVRSGPVPQSHGGLHPKVAISVSLCEGTTAQHVTGLGVRRSRPLNPEHFVFPAFMESSRVSRIRALAKVVCSLPKVPNGVYNCPADWSPSYTLHFSLPEVPAGELIRAIHYDPTGCGLVTGAGSSRRGTEAFVSALGAALGLNHANTATFAGTLTNG